MLAKWKKKAYQNVYPSLATLATIIKKHMDPRFHFTKQALEATIDMCNAFLKHITNEANSICDNRKRKTINARDIVEVLKKGNMKDYYEYIMGGETCENKTDTQVFSSVDRGNAYREIQGETQKERGGG